MKTTLRRHLSVAYQAALIAFNRSYRKGESLDEILGYTDALTGIANRKAFEEDRPAIKAYETFIMIDVDNLKQLNDTFGHLFGDTILRACADIIQKATERVGKSYRLAGDEFAIIVPECWVKTVCLYITNRIKEDGRFTISMGVASTCGTEGLTDDLFREAETELYQRKNRGLDIFNEYLTDTEEQHDGTSEPDDADTGELKIHARLAFA
jgi:diguanylate cyclase (GGDEF)-like protein